MAWLFKLLVWVSILFLCVMPDNITALKGKDGVFVNYDFMGGVGGKRVRMDVVLQDELCYAVPPCKAVLIGKIPCKIIGCD